MHELLEIGPASLRVFLARWYGPPDREPVLVARPHLPPPLVDWYESTSAYSRPLTSQNHVLAPEDLRPDGDRLVFWLEDQGVYEWAVERGAPDPLVDERATGVGEPWRATGVRLGAFLVTVAAFEAVMSAPHVARGEGLTSGQLARALEGLRPLPVPGPMFRGQLHASAAGAPVLAFTTSATRDGPGSWWVWLAAQDQSALAHLMTLEGEIELL